jgi:ribonuclease HI
MEPASYIEGPVIESPWQVYYDGAWGSTGAGAAVILISPSGIKLRYIARLQFTKETDKCTNNIVEYKTILLGLHKLRAMGGPKLHPKDRLQDNIRANKKRVYC